MIQTLTCLNCGHMWVYGLEHPGWTSEDDPLPVDRYGLTCTLCRPDLDYTEADGRPLRPPPGDPDPP